MGWGSAGSIFDPTIQALIEAGATDAVITKVAVNLINTLRDNDWDTYDESLEAFKDNRAVVAAFAECGIYKSYRLYERMPDHDLAVTRDVHGKTTDYARWMVAPGNSDAILLSKTGEMGDIQGTLVTADLASSADLFFMALSHRMVPKLLDEIERLRHKLIQEYDETEP